MRKLIFAMNMTLDGCCDHTKHTPDAEIFEYYTKLLGDADLMVYGRKTYQLMVPYWPDVKKDPSATRAEKEYADVFCSLNKVVFSKSLESAEDGKTRIVRANLRDEILKLKEEPGGNILTGGVNLPSQLIELGLIDEYRFVISPGIVGDDTRLLEGRRLPQKLQLKFIESKIFESGCVLLRYLKQ